MPRFVTRKLAGWGNYAPRECRIYRPEKSSETVAIIQAAGERGLICRGFGRSYGDSAVSDQAGVVLFTRFY